MFFQKYQFTINDNIIYIYLPHYIIKSVDRRNPKRRLYNKKLAKKTLTSLIMSKVPEVTFDILENLENNSPETSQIFMTKKTLNTIYRLIDKKSIATIKYITIRYHERTSDYYLTFEWSDPDLDNHYRISLVTNDLMSDPTLTHLNILPSIKPLYDKMRELETALLYIPPGLGGEMYQKAKQDFEKLNQL